MQLISDSKAIEILLYPTTDDHATSLIAYQVLVNSGVMWNLPENIQSTARQLLNDGILRDKQ
jgi:hypothetical protein